MSPINPWGRAGSAKLGQILINLKTNLNLNVGKFELRLV